MTSTLDDVTSQNQDNMKTLINILKVYKQSLEEISKLHENDEDASTTLDQVIKLHEKYFQLLIILERHYQSTHPIGVKITSKAYDYNDDLINTLLKEINIPLGTNGAESLQIINAAIMSTNFQNKLKKLDKYKNNSYDAIQFTNTILLVAILALFLATILTGSLNIWIAFAVISAVYLLGNIILNKPYKQVMAEFDDYSQLKNKLNDALEPTSNNIPKTFFDKKADANRRLYDEVEDNYTLINQQH